MEYTTASTAIKSWAEEDRPREKLLLKGKSSLSTAELIAILIGSGSRNESAVELSKRILSKYKNNLNELSKLNLNDFTDFKGIGEAKAISIIAAMELGKRFRATEALKKQKIKTSQAAYDVVYSLLSGINYEEFYVILLNRAIEVIAVRKVSEGGTSGTVVDPKKVFKLGLIENASSMILCHNHPSGNTMPSHQDRSITKNFVSIGKLLQMEVLDHLIVGNGTFYSFADNGDM
ncbi:MAG: DNA repair protein RadC [Bacteroidales bacterium]|nr:DNA repair protein RadC [Bacteroidales bacterium]